jgi:hypothetical protein
LSDPAAVPVQPKYKVLVNLQVEVTVAADSHLAARNEAIRVCKAPAVRHITVLKTEAVE